MKMNSAVRLRLQRVLFILCACASGALVCPDWREIWYYVLYGDPTLDGGEMTFMIVLIAILAPLAAGSFIGASVIYSAALEKSAGCPDPRHDVV